MYRPSAARSVPDRGQDSPVQTDQARLIRVLLYDLFLTKYKNFIYVLILLISTFEWLPSGFTEIPVKTGFTTKRESMELILFEELTEILVRKNVIFETRF